MERRCDECLLTTGRLFYVLVAAPGGPYRVSVHRRCQKRWEFRCGGDSELLNDLCNYARKLERCGLKSHPTARA
jgi:hypothetical protein